ncbi:hypothetical protein [Cellulomonas sp. HZM]|nr:hypothetical protein [Cellulomonas sp. HZM]
MAEVLARAHPPKTIWLMSAVNSVGFSIWLVRGIATRDRASIVAAAGGR